MSGEISSLVAVVSHWISSDWGAQNSLIRSLVLPVAFSGFGAFAGAMLAYRFRIYEERHRSATKNLNAHSISAITAGMICNAALGMKRQHVSGTCGDYFLRRSELMKELGTPTVRKSIKVFFELYTLTCPSFFSEDLIKSIKEMQDGDGRDLLQAVALMESINNLEKTVDQRNLWISDFQGNHVHLDNQERINLYYGVPDETNNRDERYYHLMQQLQDSTDDIIFHSHEIYKRISKRLISRSERYEIQYGKKFSYNLLDFSASKERGLFPDPKNYKDWLAEPVEKKRKWWMSRRRWLAHRLDMVN